MNKVPDFMIIGAMKCATSTLHEQLQAQPGIFMTALKEPNFFSNDEHYEHGINQYLAQFANAQPDEYWGESSTHYTKLPTYPHTIERLVRHCPNTQFIYVMRHPIDRLVSQYIHEWTQRVIPPNMPIDEAIQAFPEMVSYSCYAYQLQPYFDQFGRDRLLPVFFERLFHEPQTELERICQFIGYDKQPQWNTDLEARNVSSERMIASQWRDVIVNTPVLKEIRQRVIPKSFRNWVRGLWTMKEKPKLSIETQKYLIDIFDRDLEILGTWLNSNLSCQTFKQTVRSVDLEWSKRP